MRRDHNQEPRKKTKQTTLLTAILTMSAVYWSAGILPAFVLRFSGGRPFEFRIGADVPLAGKMPALIR
jgi:hypothetical protein